MRSVIFVVLLALAAAARGQSTPEQVVQNINALTQKSRDLQAAAESINEVNGPLLLIGQGPFPQIISGYDEIESIASAAIDGMQGMPPVDAGAQADVIFNAFQDFAQAHQQFLSILTGKAGLFDTVPFIAEPVASALRQAQSVLDSFAFSVIDTVQSRATDLVDQLQSLDSAFSTAITACEGVVYYG